MKACITLLLSFILFAVNAQPEKLLYKLDSIITHFPDSSETPFAALYVKSTSHIKKLKNEDTTLHGGFIDSMVNAFSELYFSAVNNKYQGKTQHKSWTLALQDQTGDAPFIKSLLLGINAHINHDLVFALKRSLNSANKDSINAYEKDYEKLFSCILASSAETRTIILSEMTLTEKERKKLENAGKYIDKQINKWRKKAWKCAVKCINNPEKEEKLISRHIKKSEKLALLVYNERLALHSIFAKAKNFEILERKVKLAKFLR